MCHYWSKETANLSGAHEFTSWLWGFVLLNFLFLGIVLCQFLSFSFSFLPMYCLSFFDITTSDYSLGIFKFFLQKINTESKTKMLFSLYPLRSQIQFPVKFYIGRVVDRISAPNGNLEL